MNRMKWLVALLLLCAASSTNAQEKERTPDATLSKYPACRSVHYKRLPDSHLLVKFAAKVTERLWGKRVSAPPIFVRKGVSMACLCEVYAAQPTEGDTPEWHEWFFEFSTVDDLIHSGMHPMFGLLDIVIGEDFLKVPTDVIAFGIAHEVCHGARQIINGHFNSFSELEFAVNEVVVKLEVGISQQRVVQGYRTARKILEKRASFPEISPPLRTYYSEKLLKGIDEFVLLLKKNWNMQ